MNEGSNTATLSPFFKMDGRQAVGSLSQAGRCNHHQVHLRQAVDIGVLHRSDGVGV